MFKRVFGGIVAAIVVVSAVKFAVVLCAMEHAYFHSIQPFKSAEQLALDQFNAVDERLQRLEAKVDAHRAVLSNEVRETTETLKQRWESERKARSD